MNPDCVNIYAEDMQPAQVAFHDGGPAFPGQVPTGFDPRTGDFVTGMSLRDYFAAKTMQGDWAAQDGEHIGAIDPSISEESLLEMAKLYYRMADQMLIASKQ